VILRRAAVEDGRVVRLVSLRCLRHESLLVAGRMPSIRA
jgi:hypothetical protein